MTLHLTSQWFIKPNCEQEVLDAVTRLASCVEAEEPDTLTYLVHVPHVINEPNLPSLPPADSRMLLFFEVYRDVQAFQNHLRGRLFTEFVHDFGDRFVSANGKPFTTVQFLSLHAGFSRGSTMTATATQSETAPPLNQHPCVMFEVIANNQEGAKSFYSNVFGWRYEIGTGGFAYVHFPVQIQPLLGGIGQANSTAGFEPGHNFYILVEDLAEAIARAKQAGGTLYMPITSLDGYSFAMVKDPEGNPIGLIKPFAG